MKLTVEVKQETLTCEAVTGLIGREPYREPIFCGRFAEHGCFHCGLGVCIQCTLPCYTCGEQLHEDCRDDHAKETGHQAPAMAALLREIVANSHDTAKIRGGSLTGAECRLLGRAEQLLKDLEG